VISGLAKLAAASPLISLLVAINLGLSLPIAYRVVFEPMSPIDWHVLTEAGRDIMAGMNPYAGTTPDAYRWSPLLAYFFWAIEPIGHFGWTLLTLAPVAILRDPRLIILFLAAWPLWRDVETGVSFLFVPLLALLALRGSRAAGCGYAAVMFLIPRPLMLPVMGWLLWHRPELRIPTVVIGVVLITGTVLTGWGDEWVAKLLLVGSEPGYFRVNVLQELGPAWILMLGLGTWLTMRGRLGLASIAVAPYWVLSYALMLILEFRDRDEEVRRSEDRRRNGAAVRAT